MKKIILITIVLFCIGYINQDIERHFSSHLNYSLPKLTPTVEKTFKVCGTMYFATSGQCDSSPLVTACGYKINPKKASEHKWIAVSRDLLKVFKYGDKVKITNAGKKDGIYTIADCMNKRFVKRIDFLETEGVSLYKLKGIILTKIS